MEVQQFDAEMLRQACEGDDTAMAAVIARMMPAIRKGAAANLAPSMDFDDAVQEGLIGLFDAVRHYDASRSEAFPAFAAACIYNAQADARRKAQRKKHAPLNNSVPLPEDSSVPGPEELALAGEAYADVLQKMSTELSAMERDTLLAVLDGKTAAQVADETGRTQKAVDNALSRARRKLKQTRI